MEYDFFTAFEDYMRITADHVLNFLDMSADIDSAWRDADQSFDGIVHVDDAVKDLWSERGKSTDKAKVGNDVAASRWKTCNDDDVFSNHRPLQNIIIMISSTSSPSHLELSKMSSLRGRQRWQRLATIPVCSSS